MAYMQVPNGCIAIELTDENKEFLRQVMHDNKTEPLRLKLLEFEPTAQVWQRMSSGGANLQTLDLRHVPEELEAAYLQIVPMAVKIGGAPQPFAEYFTENRSKDFSAGTDN